MVGLILIVFNRHTLGDATKDEFSFPLDANARTVFQFRASQNLATCPRHPSAYVPSLRVNACSLFMPDCFPLSFSPIYRCRRPQILLTPLIRDERFIKNAGKRKNARTPRERIYRARARRAPSLKRYKFAAAEDVDSMSIAAVK